MAMKKGDVPFTIRAMGIMASIVAKLVKMVLVAGLTEEDVHRLDKPEGEPVLERMVAVMVEAWGLVKYVLTVDYSQTVEQMVVAVKCGGYVNPEINTKNFGGEVVAKQGVKEDLKAVLLHLDRETTSPEVLAEMERKGLRPARLAELLAFGAKHPEFQREFPIIALGSSCVLGGGRRVPVLWGHASGCCLGLRYFGNGWYAGCRFLAVSK